MRDLDDILIDRLLGIEITPEEENLLAERLTKDGKEFSYMLGRLKLSKDFSRAYRKNPTEGVKSIHNKISRQKRRKTTIRWSSVAAGIALIIGIGLLWGKYDSHRSNSVTQLASGQVLLKLDGGQTISLKDQTGIIISDEQKEISLTDNTLNYLSKEKVIKEEFYTVQVTSGAEFHLVMDDGTKVWLNAGSEFRYPIRFIGNSREVEIIGEAFFEVAHDSLRPFHVKAGLVDATVLGTSFNIRNYPGQSPVAVTLAEGSLRVNTPDNKYTITPGIQVTFYRDTKQSYINEVELERYISWKDGYYYFNKTPLQEIMNTLALWYDVEIVYKDESVKEILFSGQLRKYDDISTLFRHFEYTNHNIKFTQNSNVITISKER